MSPVIQESRIWRNLLSRGVENYSLNLCIFHYPFGWDRMWLIGMFDIVCELLINSGYKLPQKKKFSTSGIPESQGSERGQLTGFESAGVGGGLRRLQPSQDDQLSQLACDPGVFLDTEFQCQSRKAPGKLDSCPPPSPPHTQNHVIWGCSL